MYSNTEYWVRILYIKLESDDGKIDRLDVLVVLLVVGGALCVNQPDFCSIFWVNEFPIGGTYNKRQKMRWDAWVKVVFFPRKKITFTQASLFIFGRPSYIAALEGLADCSTIYSEKAPNVFIFQFLNKTIYNYVLFDIIVWDNCEFYHSKIEK